MDKNVDKQKGWVLLENLIALLILTIGILGIISYQAVLLGQSGNALLRLKATLLAQELIALVNADNLNAACYVVPISQQSGCSSTAASSYTQSWVNEVTSTLPGAASNQPVASLANNGQFTVTIQWKRANEIMLHNFTATTQVGSS